MRSSTKSVGTSWRSETSIPQRSTRTLTLMNTAFDDALVEDWQPLVVGLELPDLDDRHVLAAAIAGGAQTIVTFNLVDFPAKQLRPTTSTRFIPTHSCSTNWISRQLSYSAHSPNKHSVSATPRWTSAGYSPVSKQPVPVNGLVHSPLTTNQPSR
jgi:hypothetical protein